MEYSTLLHYYSLRYYYYYYHHHGYTECIMCYVRVCVGCVIVCSQGSVLRACFLKRETWQSQQLGVRNTILRKTIPCSSQIKRVLGFTGWSTPPQASVPAWEWGRHYPQSWMVQSLRRIHGDARRTHFFLACARRGLLLQTVCSRDKTGGDGTALRTALHGRAHLDGVSPWVV